MKHAMKYGMDSGLRNVRGYIAAFLKANIRTTFTYPKTIWYSLRYNAGEKFILHSNILYPFKYDIDNSKFQDKEPVRLSTSLITNLLEIQIQQYKQNISPNQKSVKILTTNFQNNLQELFKLFQYNRENENFDVPVAVPARVLYSLANLNKIQTGININEKFDKEVLEFMVNCFIKKIEYADADSISQTLFAMNKLNLYENEESWMIIIQALQGKNFEVEFTHVTPYYPLLFRYKEVEDFSRKDMFLSELGNKLFILGYKSLFEAFYAIKKATEKNDKINADEVLKNLKQKFVPLEHEYFEYEKDL